MQHRLSRTCSISSGFNRPQLSSLLSTALHCLLRRRRTYAAADSLIFTNFFFLRFSPVRAEPDLSPGRALSWSSYTKLEAYTTLLLCTLVRYSPTPRYSTTLYTSTLLSYTTLLYYSLITNWRPAVLRLCFCGVWSQRNQ